MALLSFVLCSVDVMDLRFIVEKRDAMIRS